MDPEKEYTFITDGTVCKSSTYRGAEYKKYPDLLQQKFFQYFKEKCPEGGWKNDPDDRVVDIG